MEALERRVTGRCRHGTVDACILAEETMNDLPLRSAADIGAVEDRFFTLRNFSLTDGTVMPEATIAYETYGRPAPDGRNAILCAHGYTGSHHFAGRSPANGNQPGSWDGLIGPGKAIDTDKLFVVASNMLGSSVGSTNAGSINPQTGGAYGPDFPNITIRDIVAAQKTLLDHLGVRHLVAVAGPSCGGYQAFQWAVAYRDFMDAIVPVNVIAPDPVAVAALLARRAFSANRRASRQSNRAQIVRLSREPDPQSFPQIYSVYLRILFDLLTPLWPSSTFPSSDVY
jgi:homoserine acetyltransferase